VFFLASEMGHGQCSTYLFHFMSFYFFIGHSPFPLTSNGNTASLEILDDTLRVAAEISITQFMKGFIE
jgi:hypothetical protein